MLLVNFESAFQRRNGRRRPQRSFQRRVVVGTAAISDSSCDKTRLYFAPALIFLVDLRLEGADRPFVALEPTCIQFGLVLSSLGQQELMSLRRSLSSVDSCSCCSHSDISISLQTFYLVNLGSEREARLRSPGCFAGYYKLLLPLTHESLPVLIEAEELLVHLLYGECSHASSRVLSLDVLDCEQICEQD